MLTRVMVLGVAQLLKESKFMHILGSDSNIIGLYSFARCLIKSSYIKLSFVAKSTICGEPDTA